MALLYSRRASRLKELPEPFVSERLNHAPSVMLRTTQQGPTGRAPPLPSMRGASLNEVGRRAAPPLGEALRTGLTRSSPAWRCLRRWVQRLVGRISYIKICTICRRTFGAIYVFLRFNLLRNAQSISLRRSTAKRRRSRPLERRVKARCCVLLAELRRTADHP